MRTQYVTILVGMLLATSCHTVSPGRGGGHSGSGLTAIEFKNLPKMEELKKFFGADANVALLDSISIVVQPVNSSCAGATFVKEVVDYKDAFVKEVVDYKDGKIGASVFPGCDYFVTVGLGQKVKGTSVAALPIAGANPSELGLADVIAKNQSMLTILNSLMNPLYVNFAAVNITASALLAAKDGKFPFDVTLKLTKFGLDEKFPESPVFSQQSPAHSEGGDLVTIVKDVYTGYSELAYSMAVDGESVVKDLNSYRRLNYQVTTSESDPSIDFSKVMLIGAIRKVDSSDYALKITDVRQNVNEKMIRAKVVFYTPGNGCPSSAARAAAIHYVAIPKSDFEVKFNVTQEVKHCN